MKKRILKTNNMKNLLSIFILASVFACCNSKSDKSFMIQNTDMMQNTESINEESLLTNTNVDSYYSINSNNTKNLIIETKQNKTKKILIIGCGTVKFISQDGREHNHNSDLTNNVVIHTLDNNKNTKPTFHIDVNEIKSLNITPDTYHEVIFEYIPNKCFKENIFKEVFKILKPNGILKIEGLPNYLTKNGEIKNLLFWSSDSNPRNYLAYPHQEQLEDDISLGVPYFFPNSIPPCLLNIFYNPCLNILTCGAFCCGCCCGFCCTRCLPCINYCFTSTQEKIKQNKFKEANILVNSKNKLSPEQHNARSLAIVKQYFNEIGFDTKNHNIKSKKTYLSFTKPLN